MWNACSESGGAGGGWWVVVLDGIGLRHHHGDQWRRGGLNNGAYGDWIEPGEAEWAPGIEVGLSRPNDRPSVNDWHGGGSDNLGSRVHRRIGDDRSDGNDWRYCRRDGLRWGEMRCVRGWDNDAAGVIAGLVVRCFWCGYGCRIDGSGNGCRGLRGDHVSGHGSRTPPIEKRDGGVQRRDGSRWRDSCRGKYRERRWRDRSIGRREDYLWCQRSVLGMGNGGSRGQSDKRKQGH